MKSPSIPCSANGPLHHLARIDRVVVHGAAPEALVGLKVAGVRDYLNGIAKKASGTVSTLDAPKGDLVILDLETEGNYLAVRPSGTEPKVKIYLFAYDPPAAAADLTATKTAQAERLKAIGDDFRKYAGV